MIPDPAAIARALMACGIGSKRIAKVMPWSYSTIYRWTHPAYAARNRALSNAAKRRRSGVCVDCGAPTRYGGKTPSGVSLRCVPCGKIYSAQQAITLWPRERIIAAMRQWNAIHGRPPSIAEWWLATDRSPSFNTVFRRFGSFNAGLEAAGFAARPVGGYAGMNDHAIVVNAGRLKHREVLRNEGLRRRSRQ